MSHPPKTLFLILLIALSGINFGDSLHSAGRSLRVRQSSDKALDMRRDGPTLEVVNRTDIQKANAAKCLCELGYFWHWRIHQCIEQGHWGYECGFFPHEHHHRVCHDGLKCQLLNKEDTYSNSGMYAGTAKSVPASCQQCTAQDVCPVGETRHNEECLQELTLNGEATCTVRVTFPASATASATESHTMDGHEATATSVATASANGVVENFATVTIAEAKKELGLDPTGKVGEVLAARIIDTARRMAYERASKYAIAEAKKQVSLRRLLPQRRLRLTKLKKKHE